MAGLAVALEAGVDLDAAVAALASLTAGDKRGQVIEIAGATILNDSYNSNPEALRSMIRTLAARPAEGRRILVAGEMLEMGEHGPRAAHRLRTRRRRGWARSGRRGSGQRRTPGHRRLRRWSRIAVSSRRRCRRPLAAQNLRPGDQVLVKGSRGVHLERAIEAVKNQLAPATPK